MKPDGELSSDKMRGLTKQVRCPDLRPCSFQRKGHVGGLSDSGVRTKLELGAWTDHWNV